MNPSSRTTGTGAPTRSILVEALPIGAAVAAYGLSYGVLAVAAGVPAWLATAMSLVVLAGGSQFAFIGVLAAGGAPMAGAAAGLLVNARYVAFGFAIAAHLPGGSKLRRLLDGYLVVDESVALALGRGEVDRPRRFRLAGWTVMVAWVGASAVGAYGGALIGDPATLGLDAAFPAGFLALLAPWLRTRQGRIAAILGAGLALGLAPVTPPGVPIVAASLGAVVAMLVPPAPAVEHHDHRVGTTDAGHPSVGDLGHWEDHDHPDHDADGEPQEDR
jgi:predicted branched-subunit amino acid permease